jgi:oxygen-independent coproporphyrinogen III oxidase
MSAFNQRDISVYIHIPFYIKLRLGEDALLVPSTRETRNAYLDALEDEMMSAGDLLEGRRIASISIGGGIATVVSPDRLARIMIKFKRTYNVEPGAELSVTAAPQTLVSPCLSGLNMCSINRISIIALTPIDELLETIEAPHRLQDLETGTEILGKFGYPNLDALLLYGIPGQTLAHIHNTLVAFTSMKGLKHVTLQRYELSEQLGITRDECEAQYSHAVETLVERGMNQYTAECFARKGWESHFVMHELLGMERAGFGLGARSCIDHVISQNTTDFDSYLRDSADFTKVITGAVEMSEPDRMRRFAALRLQLVEGFTEADYLDEFGGATGGALSALIDPLVAAGLVSHANGSYQPTPTGLARSKDVVRAVMGA